jgi:hypothetical protein
VSRGVIVYCAILSMEVIICWMNCLDRLLSSVMCALVRPHLFASP